MQILAKPADDEELTEAVKGLWQLSFVKPGQEKIKEHNGEKGTDDCVARKLV